MNSRAVPILIADDDPDDRDFIRKALVECRLANELIFVSDGVELMERLEAKTAHGSLPALILLDLNMPRMDGFEVLRALAGDARLRGIPVVVLTTSALDADIVKSYDLGVNSFITKPVTFDGLVAAMRMLKTYWFELVELPAAPAAH